MAKDLAGATVISEKVTNEAGAKMNAVKRETSFAEFIATKEKVERESLKPLSSDLETMEKVDQKTLMELQGRKENGSSLKGGVARLVGWDPKTRTALVLKLAFIEKKAKAKKGE